MKLFSGYSLKFSRPELALVAITISWGGTFLLVHIAVRYCGPFFFVGFRFMIAALLLAFVFRKTLRDMTWQDIQAGSAIGIAIFLGYSLQTMGLQTITSSQSAFITALYVPMVPLLQWFFLRRPPGLTSWLGVFLAFAGLVLISSPDKTSFAFSVGETVALFSALAIALEIILISYFAAGLDSRRVTIIQLLVASLVSFTAMPVVGEAWPQFSWIWVSVALALGVMSAVIQLTMNWAQKSVSPTRATIIYTGELVWAGIIGRLAGERLPPAALLGVAFIVAGVLVAELKPFRRSRTLFSSGIEDA